MTVSCTFSFLFSSFIMTLPTCTAFVFVSVFARGGTMCMGL